MKQNLLKLSSFIFLTMILAACGSKSQPAEESEEPVAMVEEEAPLYEIGENQKVFFVNLEDGAEVSSPLTVEMGVEGMQVEPAGAVKENYGHHHIIIDGSFVPMGEVVPANETNIHYGDGSTEAELELSPGSHTLTMQFADGIHQSYGEAMSATIEINVVE